MMIKVAQLSSRRMSNEIEIIIYSHCSERELDAEKADIARSSANIFSSIKN